MTFRRLSRSRSGGAVGYAVELYFDAKTEATITSAWDLVVAEGVGDDLGAIGFRPHITLSICEELPDPVASLAELRQLCADSLPLSVTLASLGLFPGTVLFLAPVMTLPLLKLHQRVWRLLEGLSDGVSPLYAPGRWVPHATLSLNLRPDEVPRAVQAAATVSLPLEGQLVEVGLSSAKPDPSRLRVLLS